MGITSFMMIIMKADVYSLAHELPECVVEQSQVVPSLFISQPTSHFALRVTVISVESGIVAV